MSGGLALNKNSFLLIRKLENLLAGKMEHQESKANIIVESEQEM